MKAACFSHNLHDFSTTFNRLLCHQGTLKLAKKGKVSFSPVRLQNASTASQSSSILLENQEQRECRGLQYTYF